MPRLVAAIQSHGTNCLSASHCAVPTTAPAIRPAGDRCADGVDRAHGQVRDVTADREPEESGERPRPDAGPAERSRRRRLGGGVRNGGHRVPFVEP